MKADRTSRRDFLKVGSAGALGMLAVNACSAQAIASAPAENRPPEGKVRVAVVQMETVPGAVEKNRTKALAFAGEALKKGADIVLFHEELIVGYVQNLKELAEAADGPTSRAFQSLLTGSQSLVLWGLTERDGDRYFIAATLVGASGVQANYRKTHLWWDAPTALRHEPSFYEPGNELVTFSVKGHKCGVMLCYDGDFPEMTRCYANLGCGMLFWLNNRGSRGFDEVRGLATQNSMIMPTACSCGKNERSIDCPGLSNITDHKGHLLSQIVSTEGVIYADVDPAEALGARAKNPWYVGRRPDLYQRYM